MSKSKQFTLDKISSMRVTSSVFIVNNCARKTLAACLQSYGQNLSKCARCGVLCICFRMEQASATKYQVESQI